MSRQDLRSSGQEALRSALNLSRLSRSAPGRRISRKEGHAKELKAVKRAASDRTRLAPAVVSRRGGRKGGLHWLDSHSPGAKPGRDLGRIGALRESNPHDLLRRPPPPASLLPPPSFSLPRPSLSSRSCSPFAAPPPRPSEHPSSPERSPPRPSSPRLRPPSPTPRKLLPPRRRSSRSSRSTDGCVRWLLSSPLLSRWLGLLQRRACGQIGRRGQLEFDGKSSQCGACKRPPSSKKQG